MTASFYSRAKTVSTLRNKAILRVESALDVWITDCRKKNIPVDNSMMREKVRSLYHQFAVDGYVEEEEAAQDQV